MDCELRHKFSQLQKCGSTVLFYKQHSTIAFTYVTCVWQKTIEKIVAYFHFIAVMIPTNYDQSLSVCEQCATFYGLTFALP